MNTRRVAFIIANEDENAATSAGSRSHTTRRNIERANRSRWRRISVDSSIIYLVVGSRSYIRPWQMSLLSGSFKTRIRDTVGQRYAPFPSNHHLPTNAFSLFLPSMIRWIVTFCRPIERLAGVFYKRRFYSDLIRFDGVCGCFVGRSCEFVCNKNKSLQLQLRYIWYNNLREIILFALVRFVAVWWCLRRLC